MSNYQVLNKEERDTLKTLLKKIHDTRFNEAEEYVENIIALNEVSIQETFKEVEDILNEAFPLKGEEYSHKIVTVNLEASKEDKNVLDPKRLVKVSDNELVHLLICFFRYSLGRSTYVVQECNETLKKYWYLIPVHFKKQIIKDIEFHRKSEANRSRDFQCDLDSWLDLLDFAKSSLVS